MVGNGNGIPPTPVQGDGEGIGALGLSRSPSAPVSPVTTTDPAAAMASGSQSQDNGPPGSARKKAGRSVPIDPLSRRFGKAIVNEDDVEREFWRLTESTYDTVEVEYGADVHSTTHGRYVVALLWTPRYGRRDSGKLLQREADEQRCTHHGNTPSRFILERRLESQQYADPP